MDILARTHVPASWVAGFKYGVLILQAVLLLSCGGDSGVAVGNDSDAIPVVIDYPLFYVKKPLLKDDMGILEQTDIRDLLAVQFGGDLYMRVRASVSAPETNLTGTLTNGLGDVRDVSVSHDGEKVLFAMRFPVDPDGDEEDQPFWNIWEYDIPSDTLRRVMADDITANEGHDIGPQYLPDDRIIFASTRQNRSVAKLTDQNKPQFAALDENQDEPAFVLHIMDADGDNDSLQQVSFNQSHDMYPSVMAIGQNNGRILFSRWDGMVRRDAISLYVANPDGSNMQLLYGASSHATGTAGSTVQFIKARELPDGRILAILLPFSGTTGGGDLVVIDVANYLNNSQTNIANQGVLTGPAQVPATVSVVSTVPGFSEGGRFSSVWPLMDGTNRALVSWSGCAVQLIDPLAVPLMDPDVEPILPCTPENLANPLAVEADPAYGIWVYDFGDDTQRPVVVAERGFIITDVALAQPRNRPTVILDRIDAGVLDPVLVAEDAGILHIRSVYDIDGVDFAAPDYQTVADPALTTADERFIRFLRVYKAVAIPHEDVLDFENTAFGVSRIFGMREIVGYAPIEPDGSVRVKVPADVPISIEVLNKEGHRITPRHQHWLQVRPGEVRECNGCHLNSAGVSHGRADAFNTINPGVASAGDTFPNTLSILTDPGDTMALARTRLYPDELVLSVDLEYQDVWTDPVAAGRLPDADYSLTYAAITATPLPEMYNCSPWTVNCRVVIHYEDHIHPLWEAERPVIDPITLLETANHRCVNCHAFRYPDHPSVDSADRGNVVDPVDRGQLELTGNASGVEPDHMVSYRELLFGDTLEELLDPDTLVEVLTDQGNVDPVTGLPILEPVAIGSPLSVAGAYATPAFFFRFSTAGAHPDWLSPEELRLIAEWIDLGAQYYNDPFASVP